MIVKRAEKVGASRLVPAVSEVVFSHQAAGTIPAAAPHRQRDHRDDILTLLLTSSHSLSQPAATELADC